MAADLAADADEWERSSPAPCTGSRAPTCSGSPSTTVGTDEPLKPTTDKNAHGVGVTAAVLEANPGAVTILVEGISDDSEEWAFTHPSVDIVTTSYGFPASPPVPYHLHRSYTGVVGNGKLHFGAVDNSPALSPRLDRWALVVDRRGRLPGGPGPRGGSCCRARRADVVGNFTQTLPYCMDCQEGRNVRSRARASRRRRRPVPRRSRCCSPVRPSATRAASSSGGPRGRAATRKAATGRGADGTEDGAGRGRPVTPPVRCCSTASSTASHSSAPTGSCAARSRRPRSYPGFDRVEPDRRTQHPLDAAATCPVLDAAPWLTTGWGLDHRGPRARGVVPELLAHLGVEGDPTRSRSEDGLPVQHHRLIEVRYLVLEPLRPAGRVAGCEDDDPYIALLSGSTVEPLRPRVSPAAAPPVQRVHR
jgi:hypothetical protein